MNKFKELIIKSGPEIKAQRAQTLADATFRKQTALVNKLKDELAEIDLQIEQITDIAPTNTYSLKPGGKSFDPSKWVEELHRLKRERYNTEIDLSIAVETLNSWFGEIPNVTTDQKA